jgi:hypothetical protein
MLVCLHHLICFILIFPSNAIIIVFEASCHWKIIHKTMEIIADCVVESSILRCSLKANIDQIV